MTEALTAVEFNCTTGEVIERPLTDAEMAEREASRIAHEAQVAEDESRKEAEATAKASAQAKLTALGLTAEEIAALIK